MSTPNFDHIFIIMMENHSYEDLIGNPDAPYINAVASAFGLAGNYYGVTHPSLPNYMAATGGDTFFTVNCLIDANGTCTTAAPSIADGIEASARDWKAYMEDMPSACFLGDSYPYLEKHNPFIHYDGIRNDPVRCSRIVPYSELATDLASEATTPSFVWITPNMCNDMHDCSVATGDAWLSQEIENILRSPAYTTYNSLIVITWDEGGTTDRVATILIGPAVISGFLSSLSYDHYSLLKTIEDAWGLTPLTANDTAAAAMQDFFP